MPGAWILHPGAGPGAYPDISGPIGYKNESMLRAPDDLSDLGAAMGPPGCQRIYVVLGYRTSRPGRSPGPSPNRG